MLTITPVSGFNVGDAVTMDALPDRRSWWERRAPKWLGGKPEPVPFNGVITLIATGRAFREYEE